MQNCQKADVGAQAFWISSDLQQSVGGGSKEQAIGIAQNAKQSSPGLVREALCRTIFMPVVTEFRSC
jgi:hypothetical protein